MKIEILAVLLPPFKRSLLLFIAMIMSMILIAAGISTQAFSEDQLSVEEMISQHCQIRGPRKIQSDAYTEISAATLGNELRKRKLIPSNQCQGNTDLNFGVLVNNPYFRIYRSSGLGTRGLAELENHLQGEDHPERLPSTIIYMNHYAYGDASENLKNYFIKKYKEWEGSPTFAYQAFAKQQDMHPLFPRSEKQFLFLHPADSAEKNVFLQGKNPLQDLLEERDFTGISLKRPAKGESIRTRGGRENLYNVLEGILSGKGPVLFHCKGGIHRTGMTALMIRYLQGGEWTRPWLRESEGGPSAISVRAKTGGPTYQMVKVGNPAEYEYFLHNPKNFRRENLQAIRELSGDLRFQCLREKFSAYLAHGENDLVSKCSFTPSAPSENAGLVDPENFSTYAVKAFEECEITHGLESKIESELNYLEAALAAPNRKIRHIDGKLTAAMTGQPSYGKDETREEQLTMTAKMIGQIPGMISEYQKRLGNMLEDQGNGSAIISPPTASPHSEKFQGLTNRYQKILHLIRKKDSTLGAYLPASL